MTIRQGAQILMASLTLCWLPLFLWAQKIPSLHDIKPRAGNDKHGNAGGHKPGRKVVKATAGKSRTAGQAARSKRPNIAANATHTPHAKRRPLVVRMRPSKFNRVDGAEMVDVPGGTFTMGDTDQKDNPPHNVTLSSYYIYKNLVTVAQYKQFCSATGHNMAKEPSWGWKEDHPIVNVSWEDAQSYCKWAGVRLPTEAEWEKAARGTDGRKYPWGNTFVTSKLQCSTSKFGDAKSTAPVGSFPEGASPYGALDMAGNVWQWCSDYYDTDFTKKANLANPTGPGFGTVRVLRGGSWNVNYPGYFRASFRLNDNPAFRNVDFGFRCVSQD